jgi:hypothetical protein
MKSTPVILFDLDGVLIRPGGYRAALRATLELAFRRMGLSDPPPGNQVLELLESQGITNEWDMAALIVGLALEQAQAKKSNGSRSRLEIGHTLDRAFETVRGWQIGCLGMDYRPLGGLVGQQVTPSAALLRAVQRGEQTFLHHLLCAPGLLEELFASVGDIALAPLTRIHQHFVVGSREFERAYQRPAQFETPSSLELHDTPLLEPVQRDALLARWRTGELGLAAFTARPSLPPRGCADGQAGFTGEAELAVGLCGLQEIPLIGFGRLRYWGGQIGLSAEQLIKPEPGHALGAILAGLTRQEWPALLAAGALLREGRLPQGFWREGNLSVHVFEDSPIGVRAARRAVELLRGQGLQVELHAWGIAVNPDKVRALQAEGAQVFADVNSALGSRVYLAAVGG